MVFECLFDLFQTHVNFDFIICDSYFCRIMSVDVGQTLKYVHRNATCTAFSHSFLSGILRSQADRRETCKVDTGTS
ncbi:hypothetical protein D3C74_75370 [compost metagenome]